MRVAGGSCKGQGKTAEGRRETSANVNSFCNGESCEAEANRSKGQLTMLPPLHQAFWRVAASNDIYTHANTHTHKSFAFVSSDSNKIQKKRKTKTKEKRRNLRYKRAGRGGGQERGEGM